MSRKLVRKVWKDPEFLALPPAEKAVVMRGIDPEYAALPEEEQHKVVFALTNDAEIQGEKKLHPSDVSRLSDGTFPGQAEFIKNERENLSSVPGMVPGFNESEYDVNRSAIQPVMEQALAPRIPQEVPNEPIASFEQGSTAAKQYPFQRQAILTDTSQRLSEAANYQEPEPPLARVPMGFDNMGMQYIDFTNPKEREGFVKSGARAAAGLGFGAVQGATLGATAPYTDKAIRTMADDPVDTDLMQAMAGVGSFAGIALPWGATARAVQGAAGVVGATRLGSVAVQGAAGAIVGATEASLQAGNEGRTTSDEDLLASGSVREALQSPPVVTGLIGGALSGAGELADFLRKTPLTKTAAINDYVETMAKRMHEAGQFKTMDEAREFSINAVNQQLEAAGGAKAVTRGEVRQSRFALDNPNFPYYGFKKGYEGKAPFGPTPDDPAAAGLGAPQETPPEPMGTPVPEAPQAPPEPHPIDVPTSTLVKLPNGGSIKIDAKPTGTDNQAAYMVRMTMTQPDGSKQTRATTTPVSGSSVLALIERATPPPQPAAPPLQQKTEKPKPEKPKQEAAPQPEPQQEAPPALSPSQDLAAKFQQHGATPEEADAVLGLWDAFAQHKGETLDDFISKAVADVGDGSKGAGTLKQAEPVPSPFFSKVEQIVKEKMPNKMPTAALVSLLKKNGATDAEIDTVLGEVRDAGGIVTKQQVVDEIAANATNFKDVVLRVNKPIVDEDGKPIYDGAGGVVQPHNNAQYADLVEPGAKDGSYREMFVTAPDTEVKKSTLVPKEVAPLDHDIEREGTGLWRMFDQETGEFVGQASMDRPHVNVEWQDGHPPYANIKNPVVRIRFNERGVPAEPKGKVYSFGDGTYGLQMENGELVTNKDGSRKRWDNAEDPTIYTQKGKATRRILFIEEMQGPSDTNQEKMPKHLRDRLYDIGVKRILAYAKANGFDGVAWTKGETQADRYDLSKQIDSIAYSVNGNGTVNYALKTKVGGIVKVGEEIPPAKLPQHVGKEIAQKMLNREGKAGGGGLPRLEAVFLGRNEDGNNYGITLDGVLQADGMHTLEAAKRELHRIAEFYGIPEGTVTEYDHVLEKVDLVTGGEGLKDLYDNWLPALFKKYGKGAIQNLDIPNRIPREKWEAFDNDENTIGYFATEEEAMDAVRGEMGGGIRLARHGGGGTIPYIPITDSTPSSYPMYQAQGEKVKGSVTFLADGRAIIDLMAGSDVSTLLHETAHIFRRHLEPEERAVANKWVGAKTDDWSEKQEERWARAFERYLYSGKAPTPKLRDIFAKIAAWLKAIYKRIKGSSIDVKVSQEVKDLFDKILTPKPKPRAPKPKTPSAENVQEGPKSPAGEANAAEPLSSPAPEPAPVKKGYVRFYHGGASGEGARWITPDLEYAKGYAAKTGSPVLYVDIPRKSPLLQKSFDDTGTSVKAPYVAFEAPAEVMAKAKVYADAPPPPKEPDFQAIYDGMKAEKGLQNGEGKNGHWTASDFQDHLRQFYPSIAGKDKRAVFSALEAKLKGRKLTEKQQAIIDGITHDVEAAVTEQKAKDAAAAQHEANVKEANDFFTEKAKEGGYADTGGYSNVPPQAPPATQKGADLSEHLAMEGPEILELLTSVNGGEYPRVLEKMYRDGVLGTFHPGKGGIDLLAEIAKHPGLLVRVLAHEIGHWADWFGDRTVKRGNILGHLASLKGYTKELLEGYPDAKDTVLTDKDRERLRQDAEKELRQAAGPEESIIETITREVPKYEYVGITPEMVKAIWTDINARDKYPKLYNVISAMSDKEKKAVMVQAMKGLVAEQLQKMGEKVQVGTETITEQVKRVVKPAVEVTPEAIAKRFKELVEEEIAKRGLFKREVIDEELRNLTLHWKPFMPGNDPFTHYRFSAVELYADALSVLFNDPALLHKLAPTFEHAFFAYLKRKPEIHDAYFALQKRLRDPDAIAEARNTALKEGFHEGEAILKEKQKPKHMPMWEAIKHAFWDKNDPINKATDEHNKQRLAKGLKELPPIENPALWAEKQAYTNSVQAAYVTEWNEQIYNKLQDAGVDLDDLGLYLLYRRVRYGDRGELANPLAHNPATAQSQLAYLKKTLGDAKYAVLEEAAETNWRLWQKHIIPLAKEMKLFSPAAMEVMENRSRYATFNFIKFLERGTRSGGASGQMYRQIGGLGKVRNPAVAMVMKGMAIIRVAEMKGLFHSTAMMLNKEFGTKQIQPARKVMGRAIDPKDHNMVLITYPHNGKAVSWYVPKFIGESLLDDPQQSHFILALFKHPVFNAPGALFRALVVNHQPLWMAGNLFRDYFSTAKQLQGMTFMQLLKQTAEMKAYGPKYLLKEKHMQLLRYYIKAYPLAMQDAMGKDPLHNRMAQSRFKVLRKLGLKADTPPAVIKGLQMGALVPERQFPTWDETADTEVERVMQRFGILPGKAQKEHSKAIRVMLDFVKLPWDTLGNLGKFTERWGKLAGQMYLEANMHGGYAAHIGDIGKNREADLAHIERSLVATPDALKGGSVMGIINNILFFSRIGLSGYRASWEAATSSRGSDFRTQYKDDGNGGKKHRHRFSSEYVWETMKMNILPKLAMKLIALGAVGAGYQQMMDEVGNYSKANYLAFPIGRIGSSKRVMTLRIPQDYTGQVLSGIFWMLIHGRFMGKRGLISFLNEAVPGSMTPVATVPYHIFQMVIGNNPYDYYRGDTIIPEQEWNAADGRKWATIAKDSWNRVGGTILYKFPSPSKVINVDETSLEKLLRLPLVGGMSRFITVEDGGIRESDEDTVMNEETTPKARAYLDVRDAIVQDINSMKGKRKPTDEDKIKLYDRLVKEKVLPVDSDPKALISKYNRYASRYQYNARVDDIVMARSTGEKAVLLRKFEKQMPPQEFEDFVKHLLDEGLAPDFKAVVTEIEKRKSGIH